MTTRNVIGTTPNGVTIVAHDGVQDWQVCVDCGARFGSGSWPQNTPYEDANEGEFGEDWDGRCPVCGCEETGLPIESMSV